MADIVPFCRWGDVGAKLLLVVQLVILGVQVSVQLVVLIAVLQLPTSLAPNMFPEYCPCNKSSCFVELRSMIHPDDILSTWLYGFLPIALS
jgi:hypothetical protein